MAHELSFINGMTEMAYLESAGTPWHNLGQGLPDNSPMEAWLAASNMGNWSIEELPLLYYSNYSQAMESYNGRKLLVRSDNKFPLADVSSLYHVVQPREVIEFFSDIIDTMGFRMDTCGVLHGGKKFWAQASIGESVHILGSDRVDGKLLLATSCDGSLATTAQYTAVRVVCQNTLNMATGTNANSVRVTHLQKFDPKGIKEMLELRPQAMLEWEQLANAMATKRLSFDNAEEFFVKVFDPKRLDDTVEETDEANNRAIKACLELFAGTALGSEYAPGTVWQAVSSVTEYADHRRKTRSLDSRVDSAWFGRYANIKDRAWDEAVLLAA